MKLDEKVLRDINMTIVFKSLDKDYIRRDKIKRLFKDEVDIIDVPNALIINFKEINAQANFAEGRLQINVNFIGNEDTGEFLATTCKKLLEAASDFDVSAYGYNINGEGRTLEFNFNEYLLNICYADGTRIEEKIETKVVSVAPRFSVNMHNAKFNIDLNPLEENSEVLRFHCNIHFEGKAPKCEVISKELTTYLGYFNNIMEKL